MRCLQHPSIDTLEEALGERIISLTVLPGAEAGAHSQVFALRTTGDEYVLRVPKGRQGFCTRFVESHIDMANWFDQRWAMDLAHGLGIPAPRIICSSRPGASRSTAFVVMERLPGVAIDSTYERWQACPYDEAEFGEILRKLHATTISGAGPIDDFGKTYFPTWDSFFQAMAGRAMDMCLARGSIDRLLHEGLRRVWFAQFGALAGVEPRLLHLESLGFSNILYDPATKHITGFLDYEDCIGGDPLFEFAWMDYYLGGRDGDRKYFSYPRFMEGYADRPGPESRIEIYSPFMLLDKLSWIRPDSERAEGYRQRLRALCAGWSD